MATLRLRPVDGNNGQAGDDAILRARGLRVRYPDGALGVHDVSIDAAPGTVTALLGPNGAGKSTTLRALGGYLRTEHTIIEAGTISFAGRSLVGAEPHVAARLGVFSVPERRKIFPNLTVQENLYALGMRLRGHDRAARTTWVEELFPLLGERRKARAGALSGGQQQMLAIARGLMAGAKALLVDEITLGLHASVFPILRRALAEIAERGTAVLISDESVDFALSVADQVCLIRAGVIVERRAPRDLSVAELTSGYLG